MPKQKSKVASRASTGYIWEHKKSVLAAQSEGSELGRDLLQILQTNDRRGPGETYECFWHLLEIMAALDVPHQELIPLLDRKLDDAVAEFERSKHSTVTDEEAVYNGKRDIIAKAASTLNADARFTHQSIKTVPIVLRSNKDKPAMALWGLKLLDEGVDTHFLEDAMTNSGLVLRFNAASIACHLPGMEDAATQILDTLYSQSSDSTLIDSEGIRWCYRNDSTD